MVVDSSVWLEIFGEGPLAEKCREALKKTTVLVPSLVVFEVYKKIKAKVSEEMALEVVAYLGSHKTLDLTREVALLAADLSLEHSLAMADSLVLAHAISERKPLLTLDNDFSNVSGATVLRK